MPNLKVPSLQHLARNWRSDAFQVKRQLVQLARNSPTFTYDPLFSAVQDMLVFGQPYEQIVEGMHRGIKRPDVLENYLGILPLIRENFDGLAPVFMQAVARRYYPVSRDLRVPFQPPLIFGVGERIHFPWFSFWRRNPIDGKRLSLFVSVVEEVLLQDPDLENAKFEILDFSAPAPNQPRELCVVDARDVPRVSAEQKTKMLAIFAEGFSMAQAELAGMADPAEEGRQADDAGRQDTPSLFDVGAGKEQ